MQMFRLLCIVNIPSLAKLCGFTFSPELTMTFFQDVLRKSMQHRRATGERRNDFVDLVLDALKNEDEGGSSSDSETEVLMTSNALLLFLAGFDTSSTSMAAVTYYLCK